MVHLYTEKRFDLYNGARQDTSYSSLKSLCRLIESSKRKSISPQESRQSIEDNLVHVNEITGVDFSSGEMIILSIKAHQGDHSDWMNFFQE